MSCLTAVEIDLSIVVGGGDLACIALRGLHGVLAPELRVRGFVDLSLEIESYTALEPDTLVQYS